jgi:hypothetical protein
LGESSRFFDRAGFDVLVFQKWLKGGVDMAGGKSTLKIEHQYQDLEWVDHYKIIEAPEGLFCVDSEKGEVILQVGAGISGPQVRSVKTKDGLRIKIETYDILGELMEDEFLFSEDEKELAQTKEKILMIMEEFHGSGKCVLRRVGRENEIVPISPGDFNESLGEVLEMLRDCVGISSADFDNGCFVFEVDLRADWKTILKDLKDWLEGYFENADLSIMTLEDYLAKRELPEFFSSPYQLRLF